MTPASALCFPHLWQQTGRCWEWWRSLTPPGAASEVGQMPPQAQTLLSQPSHFTKAAWVEEFARTAQGLSWRVNVMFSQGIGWMGFRAIHFKTRLDGALNNLVWWKMPLLMAWGLDHQEMVYKVPSNPNHSIILWFYDSVGWWEVLSARLEEGINVPWWDAGATAGGVFLAEPSPAGWLELAAPSQPDGELQWVGMDYRQGHHSS